MLRTLKTESTVQLEGSLMTLPKRLILTLTLPLLLMGCLGTNQPVEPEVVIQTEYVRQNIPIQERPKEVKWNDVPWFVITEDNLDEKIAEIRDKTGNFVIFVITPQGYENLALGIAELRRYIKDQQAIIAYYEEAVQK